MAINTNTDTNLIYSPQGASVVGGARAGNFFTPDNPINSGVEIGNVYATYLKLTNIFSNVQLATGTIPANSIGYIPLGNLTLPAGVSLVSGQYLQLEWGRALSISSSEADVSWFISGYDIYEEKLTYGNNLTSSGGTNSDTTSRCFSRISSIKVTNNSSSATSVTINLTPSVELPYYNFGTGSHLIAFNYNVTKSSNNYTLNGIIATSTTPDSPLNWDFTINNPTANPLVPNLTMSTGTNRPWLTLNDRTWDNTEFEILIKQIVYGYGTIPNWVTTNTSTLINNKISIIGGKQYSTDWVPYQG